MLESRVPTPLWPLREGSWGPARRQRHHPAPSLLCSTGEVCLVHLLLKRNPTIFYQHFIECIFHFTSFEKHESFNRFPQSERSVPRRGWHGGPGGGCGQPPRQARQPRGERSSASPRGCAEMVLLCPREKRLFSLKGGKNRERRMRIYKFLLEHFTDEQRFNITSRIFENVLGRTGQRGDKACGGNCCVARGPAVLQPRGPNVLTLVSLAIGLTFRPPRPPPSALMSRP